VGKDLNLFQNLFKGYGYLLNQDKVGSAGFKSPFVKGGFRGISGGYINPPLPPFFKGGWIISISSFLVSSG
jgi:hypothetical protein